MYIESTKIKPETLKGTELQSPANKLGKSPNRTILRHSSPSNNYSPLVSTLNMKGKSPLHNPPSVAKPPKSPGFALNKNGQNQEQNTSNNLVSKELVIPTNAESTSTEKPTAKCSQSPIISTTTKSSSATVRTIKSGRNGAQGSFFRPKGDDYVSCLNMKYRRKNISH